MTIIYSSHDDFADTARALIDLADSPYHVATTADDIPAGFYPLALVVPDYLYERYQQYKTLGSESSSPVEPKKRGPGRPRKNPLPDQE